MDDLRQRLFPIFLKETDINLAALRQFLSYEDLSTASAEELETAFRAAHTLKGTANLVQAESICKIARRLEAMLEKHVTARTKPTPVEHEALQLAIDWLVPLVAALQGNLDEPKLFVAEALQALDLAEAFPGRTPLVELIDSHSERRSPRLDDPFAADPDLLPDEDGILRAERDPFADDPDFGGGVDLLKASVGDAPPSGIVSEGASDDPFADDQDFSVADIPVATVEDVEPVAESVSSVEELPYDPFAEDSLGLDIDSVAGPGSFVETGSAGLEDIVADDDQSVVDTRKDDSPDPYVSATEAVAIRAEEIAESLLLPQDETAPRKDYSCCVFAIGGRDYHLPIKQMQEIADLPQLLPLPLAPPMVSGLVNLRGQVLPVINLAILNHHQQSEVRVQRRLVIAEHQHESLAFLADGVPHLSEDFNGEKVDMSQFLSLYRLRGLE